MFWGILDSDTDPLVRGMDPDPHPTERRPCCLYILD